MTTVSSSKLRPFINYLQDIYDDLEEISVISGIEYQLLCEIAREDTEVNVDEAKSIIDFLLAHRRITSDVFYSFEDKSIKPRFPNPDLSHMREKEIKLLRRERNKKGY